MKKKTETRTLKKQNKTSHQLLEILYEHVAHVRQCNSNSYAGDTDT